MPAEPERTAPDQGAASKQVNEEDMTTTGPEWFEFLDLYAGDWVEEVVLLKDGGVRRRNAGFGGGRRPTGRRSVLPPRTIEEINIERLARARKLTVKKLGDSALLVTIPKAPNYRTLIVYDPINRKIKSLTATGDISVYVEETLIWKTAKGTWKSEGIFCDLKGPGKYSTRMTFTQGGKKLHIAPSDIYEKREPRKTKHTYRGGWAMKKVRETSDASEDRKNEDD